MMEWFIKMKFHYKKKKDFKMSLIGHNNILFKSYYLISRLID